MCNCSFHVWVNLALHTLLPPFCQCYIQVHSEVMNWSLKNIELNCFTCTIFTVACLCLNIYHMLSGLCKISSPQKHIRHYTHCTLWVYSVSNSLKSHNSSGDRDFKLMFHDHSLKMVLPHLIFTLFHNSF